MSCRVDTAPLLAGACVVSLYAGHGVRGDQVPSTGTHGPSPIYNDLTLPADAAKEFRWGIVTPPAVGELAIYEDGSYAYTPPPGTVDLTVTYTYRLWVDGVDAGTATETIVIGAGSGGALSGSPVLGAVDPAGTLSGGAPSDLSGDVTLDPAQPGGGLDSSPPGVLGGNVPLAPVELGGTIIGDASGVLPPLDPGRRLIYAGRQVPQMLVPLDVAEVDNLTADFSTVLPLTDPPIQVDVAVEARVGTDDGAAPLRFGLPQIHGLMVRQRIQGSRGVVGVTYLIRVTALSSSGRVALAAGFVKVVRQA
jgi:hypothetical protein